MATKSKKKTKTKASSKSSAKKKSGTSAKSKAKPKAKAKTKVKAKSKTSKVTKKATKKTKATASKKKVSAKPKAKVKAKIKAKAKPKTKAPAPKKKEKQLSAGQIRKQQADEAILAAMAAEATKTEAEEEEEFDPAAFYAASGVDPDNIRPHVMRKERVDVQLFIRFRMPKSPLVHNAELINLSKGGLCIQTAEEVSNGTNLRIEIPLPHTSELFAVQAEVMWSHLQEGGKYDGQFHTGLRFLPMSMTKQSVINNFIQQRRDEIIMAKIGLDRFGDSAPVVGVE